ncbi:hypothetical protein JMF94_05400 [Desulfovibrio sp. UIB00]|uniref:hypothetical protein n=1 Tax=Desulfovibrio sp. UIB00 TaxID=2804314 RepID=UPI001F0FA164|nr:hypothetical protein [Desulfovibrio sp. UIB00]MCH5144516.1 hypothetical protein [Desulfovibrio sp. UIB00]
MYSHIKRHAAAGLKVTTNVRYYTPSVHRAQYGQRACRLWKYKPGMRKLNVRQIQCNSICRLLPGQSQFAPSKRQQCGAFGDLAVMRMKLLLFYQRRNREKTGLGVLP